MISPKSGRHSLPANGRILVEQARRKAAVRHGGGQQRMQVERDWRFARAFLFDLLSQPTPEGPGPGHE